MSGTGDHLGEKLQDIADHRLGGTKLAAANEHLAACARCRRELEALLQVKQAVAPQSGDDDVPAELQSAVSQLLARERLLTEPSMASRVRAAANSRWVFVAGFAAFLAIALVLWVLFATPR